MKNFEIRTIEHKGVKVTIKIDYDNGTASLVESTMYRENQLPFKNKQWLFANRGLEYMDSWVCILEAMKVAVGECKKELEHDLAEKTKLKDDMIFRVQKEINKKK